MEVTSDLNPEVVSMKKVEHCVEEEPVVKKAKVIDKVEDSYEVPMVEGNEQGPLLDVEEKKETCVASGDGKRNNGKVCSVAVEEGNEICVELESNETAVEEASAHCLAGQKRFNSIEKEVHVVSDFELEKNTEASFKLAVTSCDEVPVIVNEDSSVASGGTKEDIRSNPLVSPKKLLVLDLNGLLADIVSPLADVKADINIGRRAIFKRPYCEDFLKFCFDKFEVGIWSSRKKYNVERITKFLLGDMESKLLFCWDMSKCATTTLGSLENRHKYVVFKDLNRLWEKKYDPELPWDKGDYNETNTVLLDDSPYKALLNPPYTAIFPHSYNHQNKTDTSLGNGGDLRLYLEKLVDAENVQDFIKKNPFGQEAITEASESWEFYREAVQFAKHIFQDIRI